MGGFQSIVQDPVQPAEFSCEECTQKLEHLLAETFVALHGKCLPAHVGIKAPRANAHAADADDGPGLIVLIRWQLTQRYRTFSTEEGCETAAGCSELLGLGQLATRGNEMNDIDFMEQYFAMCSRFPALRGAVADLKARIEWGYMWRRC